MSIQETLDKLQPYVIGIRYHAGVPLVDVVFKEGWTLPDSTTIKKIKGEDKTYNNYMIYSEVAGVVLDNLLDYVSSVIKINLEREEKLALFKTKVDELKVVFQKNSLKQLINLKFTFADEITPEIDEYDLDSIEPPIEEIIPDPIPQQSEIVINEVGDISDITNQEPIYSDIPYTEIIEPIDDVNEEGLSEEELEILEEERRGARNLAILQKMKEKKL